MIYDCFTYFNEVDVIRFRFEELSDLDCKFVVVEADQTFSGQPKPFYFDNLPSWVNKWKDRIIRVKVSFDGFEGNAWDREKYQRNAIMQGLTDAQPDDKIVISDADEVPRAMLLDRPGGPYQLDVKQYFWKLNLQTPDHCNQGARPVLAQYADITTPQELREAILPRIPYGGWHFSFLNSDNIAQQTATKIEAFAHQEYNTESYKDPGYIANALANRTDPFDRFPLKAVDIDKTYPKWILNNLGELKSYIA